MSSVFAEKGGRWGLLDLRQRHCLVFECVRATVVCLGVCLFFVFCFFVCVLGFRVSEYCYCSESRLSLVFVSGAFDK